MKIVKVLKIEKQSQPSRVFDITVQDDHHYVLENGLVSHNSGSRYAASTVLFLSKRKEKVDNEVVGNVIHCKLDKGRFTRENAMVDVLLRYDVGLNKYYGLLPIAEKYGIFRKESTRYVLPDGSKAFEKTINENPEKYYTAEVMEKLEEAVGREFRYGNELESEQKDED
jgi:hypothetical protein